MSELDAIRQFNIRGGVESISLLEGGHINGTYRVINSQAECPDYLLQNINNRAFKDIDGLMRNVSLVTEYIRSNFNDSDFSTLKIIKTTRRDLYYKNESNEYWRVYQFFKDSRSFDLVENLDQCYRGAKAFGQFVKKLSDFRVDDLVEVIPDFHNCFFRLGQFKESLSNGIRSRIHEAQDEIKYALSIADTMCEIEGTRIKGKLPVRVTHNDTKFNNILFDKNDDVIGVVDLDTVMPGLVHYDFGDGVRTAASTALEDEEDLSKVDLDLIKFEAFTSGYMSELRDILTPNEIKFLPISGAVLSYIMGIRFLTDYLSGDKYYKTSFEGQNYQRAKCQLHLTKKILSIQSDLKDCIRNA